MIVSESLAKFAPQVQLELVLDRISRGKSLEPAVETGSAALLFIDLSGFTALTQEYAARGRQGAEQLTQIINRYFGLATDLILDHGGDVLFYAGDSILAIWRTASPDELAEAARTAASCALAIQLRSNDKDSNEPLAFRASVTAGNLSFLQLGGIKDNWQFLVAGEPVTDIADNDRAANPGEVVVNGRAWQMIGSHFSATKISEGRYKLEPQDSGVESRSVTPPTMPDSAESVLSGLVPPIVARRSRSGHQNWLAEIRNVVVLFVNLSDQGRTDSGLLQRLQPIVRKMQDVVMTLEGTIYQLLMDDKGTSLIAGFGLPPFGHEDDARRATMAAIDIRTYLAESNTPVSIGIASGPLYCGIYGTSRRQQYTIAGSAINLAARLMQHANGQILCDQAVADRADIENVFEPLEPIMLKGRSNPIPVFRVQVSDFVDKNIGKPKSPNRLFGRDSETAAIDLAMDGLEQQQRARLLLIEGDAGIGKSALLHYAEAHAHQLGLLVMKGEADSIQKGSLLQPWRSIFAALLELPTDSGLALQTIETLVQSLPPTRQQHAPLLSAVLPFDVPDNDTTAQMSEEVRSENTLNLLLEILANKVGQQPAAIILEDAHWFDSASWKLISLAMRNMESLLFVISMRPSIVQQQFLTPLLDMAESQRLTISPLSTAATTQLVCDRLAVNAVPKPVTDFIADSAGGNPFFSEELAYALLESQVIEIADGECRMSDPGSLPAKSMEKALAEKGLPDSIEGVVTSRIDRLSDDLQLTVKVASAIGRRFPVDALAAAHPAVSGADEVRRWLRELCDHEIVQVTSDEEGVFEFRHAILQDVAYNTMLFAQKREIHHLVASWYEQQPNATAESMQSVLAYHWKYAEEWEKAARHLTLAGDTALRNFANTEAISLFTDAIEMSASAESHGCAFAGSGDLQHWKLSLGRAHVKGSEYTAGRQYLEEGLALSGIKVRKSLPGAIGALFGEMIRQVLHRYRTGVVGSRRAERELLLEQARAFEGLVEAYFIANDTVRCLHAAFESLNLSELAGPSPELARGYASVGAIMGFIPMHGVATRYCERAEAAATQIDDPESGAWVSLAIGVYEAGAGNLDEANRQLSRTTSVAGQLGDRRRWDDGTQNLAATSFIRGDLEECLRYGTDLFTSAEHRGDQKNQGEALRWITHVYLVRRQLDVLPDLMQQFDRHRKAEAGLQDKYVADVRASQADFMLASGDPDGAYIAASDALKMLGTGAPSFYDLFVEQSALADVYYDLLVSNHAQDLLPQLRKLARQIKRHAKVFAIAEPTACYWEALIKRLKGNHSAAVDTLETGLASAVRMRMPIQEGRLCGELAQNETLSQSTRSEHLDRAIELLSSAGAQSDLDRIRGCGA